MTFLISQENNNVLLDDKIFDFLIFQDVEDINHNIALEMAWRISSFIRTGNDFITNFKDSILFVFSRVNWFTKNKIDFEEYVETLQNYIVHMPQTKTVVEGYLVTRICHETVAFDLKDGDWYGEQCEGLPDEVNALLPPPDDESEEE